MSLYNDIIKTFLVDHLIKSHFMYTMLKHIIKYEFLLKRRGKINILRKERNTKLLTTAVYLD